jgi:peptidyl-prolyl cis-trans isomerase B (cyclophilin B)
MRLFPLLFVSVLLLSGCGQAAEEKKVAEKKANPVVIIETSKGDIEVELFADKAPITVENFLGYVKDKFFDGTIFHRIMKDFMIQGGGYTKDMEQKKTKDPIKIEADNGVSNDIGTIAMARTDDPNSAATEFFINVADNKMLNHKSKTKRGWGYTVFGKVTKGMDVVDTIKETKVGVSPDGEPSVPLETITIKTIRLKDEKK